MKRMHNTQTQVNGTVVDLIPAGTFCSGDEELPRGGFRGDEELPKGGFRGDDELPPGGFRSHERIVSL